MRSLARLLCLFLLATPLFGKENVTFKIVGFDCAECGPPVMKALKSVDGVTNVRIDAKKESATIVLDAPADREKVRKAMLDAGFGVVYPGEKDTGFKKLPPDQAAKLDIRSYPGTTKIDIAKILAPGKVTIVDFYGEWCGPCHVLEARLQHLMAGTKPDLALRRIDIGKWDNAAGRQATDRFQAAALPYIRVYDAKGKFVEEVTGSMFDEVLAAIEKAEGK